LIDFRSLPVSSRIISEEKIASGFPLERIQFIFGLRAESDISIKISDNLIQVRQLHASLSFVRIVKDFNDRFEIEHF